MQLTCKLVTAEHLYPVGIPAGYKQVFPIGCNDEITWMAPRTALPYPDELSGRLDPEEGDAILLQPCAGIQEPAVRTDVYVGSASRMGIVGEDGLPLPQIALGIVEDRYLA